MKFEYDHKTGGMRMKENLRIHFSRAMSGGLRVDDEINRVKFVIERNGDVRFISGLTRDVNIYDQRNAHIIAERVKRMFGPNHKYSNYKLFTKGYHVIESYDEFVERLDEGLWSRTLNRGRGDSIRREEGIKVEFPLGYVYLKDLGCGLPYKLNPEKDEYWVYNEVHDIYIFGYDNGDDYTYFKYDESNDDKDDPSYHLTQLATSTYDMIEDDFILIEAMLNEDSDMVDMVFKGDGIENPTYCEVNDERYEIYDDYDVAKEKAEEYECNIIEDIADKEMVERWRKHFKDEDFLDVDEFESMMRESNKSYVNDIESEEGKHGNRLIDELIENGLIEDSDEYFETIESEDDDYDEDNEYDEDDEDEGEKLDYESPLFDIDEMKKKYVEIMCDNYESAVEWYIENFGDENLSDHIDKYKLAEKIVEQDGVANSLARYDGKERTYSNDEYEIYIYRID